MSNSTLYSWKRVWLPFGSNYNLDHNGFPIFSSYDILTKEFSSIAKTLGDLERDNCLVLIGDPGTGKSTEIALIKHESCITRKYLLRDYGSSVELFNRVEKDINSTSKVDEHLYLYFDGLDEGLLNINKLNNSLINWLDDLKLKSSTLFDRLYFRITCRSVTWSEISEGTTARLRDIFGEGFVKVFKLAPLKQEDVRLALDESGLQSSDFIGLVQDNRLHGFCLEPQSLSALIKCFREGRLSKEIQRNS